MYRLSVHIEPVTILNRQVTTLSFHGMKVNPKVCIRSEDGTGNVYLEF